MDNFLMKPKIDFAFKEIMMNEKARIGFLSAILNIEPEDIKETQILNSYLRKGHEEDKQGILDVRILMNNDTEIDTEIHLSELKVWQTVLCFIFPKCIQTKSGRDKNMMFLKSVLVLVSWILYFLKNQRTFLKTPVHLAIPTFTHAFISGKITGTFFSQIKWNFM